MEELDMLAGEAAAADNAAQPIPDPATIDATTGDAIPPEDEPAAPLLTPEEEASKLVELLAWGLKLLFPVLDYQEQTKAEAAKRLAPLLQKYNVSNTLMAKWGIEIEAGLFFGGLAYGSYLEVKASKQPEADTAKKSWWAKIFKRNE